MGTSDSQRMSSIRSAIFNMAKDDIHLEKLMSKLKSLGPHVGLAQNCDGDTLLHCAAEHGAKKTVKELAHHFRLEMQTILVCQTKKGYSPLHLVAEHGDLPMMKEVLDGLSTSDRLEVLRVKDIRGRTPLHWAAVKDKTDMVKYMLQSVSDCAFMLLSEKDSSGETTLHETAGKGRGTMLDLMLGIIPMQRFELVMNKDSMGRNLLIHAVIGGKPEDVEVVLRNLTDQQIFQLFTVTHSGGQNPFHIAMEKNSSAVLKIMLTTLAKFKVSDQKELLRSKDAQGLTCLHAAVKENSCEALSALLVFIHPSIQMDLFRSKDAEGLTCLHIAVKKKSPDGLSALLESIQSEQRMKLLCEKNKSGNTALHNAVSKKDVKSAEIIMNSIQTSEKHQLISQTNRKQQSVLQYAIVKQHTEMVKQLIECCDPAHLRELFFMTDYTGDTLLHDSSTREAFLITAHLLDAMSTSHDRYELAAHSDLINCTALHRAVNAKNVESVKCILDKLDSAERFKLVEQKHRGGQSALAVAIDLNQPEIIKAIMYYLTAEQRKKILLQHDLSHDTPLHNACSSGDSGGIASGLLEDLQNRLEGLKKRLRGIQGDSGLEKAEENPNKSTDLMQSLIDTLDAATKVELLKCKSLQGQNVLHAAASNCSLATLQYLVEGISPHALLDLLLEKDEDGHTALSAACIKSRKENVQFMLNALRNCDGKRRLILAQNLQGNTVLHLAMKTDSQSKLLKGIFGRSNQKDLPTSDKLVQSIVDNITQDVLFELLKVKNVKGKSSLHLAMKTKTSTAADIILGKIPQDVALCLVKEPDLSGKMPLQKALETPEMMRMLLGYIKTCKYESLTNINEDRQSYLHLAVLQKRSDVALLILDSLGSSSKEQLKIMAMRDCHGRTFLHVAASMNVELVRQLVQSEIYKKFIVSLLYVRDDQGRTVADSAEDEELKQELQKLLEEAVDRLLIELQQPLDEDPVNGNSREMLETLRNSRQPETQQTILHVAIQSGSIDVIKRLKEHLTDHNHWKELLLEKDSLDQSCIHFAIQKGDVECLKMLVDHELQSFPGLCLQLFAPANVWSENCANMAVRLRNSDVLEWMLEGLSDENLEFLVKQKDFRGQTALHAATKLGTERVNFLLTRVAKLKIAAQRTLVESMDNEHCTAADIAFSPKLQKYLLTYAIYYYLPQPPRCLVIYMTSGREGARSEADSLLDVLEQTRVNVTPYEDITKNRIMQVIKEAAEQDPISGLIVVVMAHGDRAVVCDSANEKVRIQDIIGCMNNDKLRGKPKLLVIQSCQGTKLPGAGLNSDAFPPKSASSLPPADAETLVSEAAPIPSSPSGGESSSTAASGYPSHIVNVQDYAINDGDFMVLCSTIRGYVSRRNYFIPKFARHLGNCSDNDGVDEVYKQTAQEMKDDTENQMPIYQSTLNRSFALKRVWTD